MRNEFALFEEMAVSGACFSFPVTLAINITSVNITLLILERK